MGAKHFTELFVWQLTDNLRQFLYEITGSGAASRAFGFRDQMRRAADSTCDNIAEGVGRYGHREFARYLTIAKGSLDENESQHLGGLSHGYFTDNQVALGRQKLGRSRQAVLRLKRYLDRTDPPEPFSASR